MYLLSLGQKGSLVSAAQLALRRSGFYSGALDGIFGEKTRTAVIDFQRANRTQADGVIGASTWALLEKYLTGYFEYTLRRGDTYWLLAQKYATSVEAIRLANPGLRDEFLRIGQKIVVPFGFDAATAQIPYSFELTRLIAKGLSVRYPFITLSSIGRSVLGRELLLLEIGEGEKEITANASHHANEWITTPVLLKFIEDYAKSCALSGPFDSQRVRKLYRETRLSAAVLINPDGADLVTGALSEESAVYKSAEMIAESYPSIPFPSGWKANILGTDLNLNYPAMWEKAKEIKYSLGFVSPAPRDFVGAAPLSAPESRAAARFTSERNFVTALAFHTQGEIIYYKYLDFNPPKSEEILAALAKASGYSPELTPENSSYAG